MKESCHVCKHPQANREWEKELEGFHIRSSHVAFEGDLSHMKESCHV